jgi:hypothetical protein
MAWFQHRHSTKKLKPKRHRVTFVPVERTLEMTWQARQRESKHKFFEGVQSFVINIYLLLLFLGTIQPNFCFAAIDSR